MIDTVIDPRVRPVGAGEVRRVLPHRACRMVGPFIFADLMGPDVLPPAAGIDIDAHPHIGLATVTYLFEGAMIHRDSTGAVQRIEPGAVNWMTAGRGVCHTERSPDDQRAVASRIAGLQTWVALPVESEGSAPSFQHQPADAVPEESAAGRGVHLRLPVGTGFGLASPIETASPLVFADIHLRDATFVLEPEHAERAVLLVSGSVGVGGRSLDEGQLAVLETGTRVPVAGTGRLIVLGGEPVGERRIWWNFVASDPERIEAAKADWEAQRFPQVPGDHDPWVPLP